MESSTRHFFPQIHELREGLLSIEPRQQTEYQWRDHGEYRTWESTLIPAFWSSPATRLAASRNSALVARRNICSVDGGFPLTTSIPGGPGMRSFVRECSDHHKTTNRPWSCSTLAKWARALSASGLSASFWKMAVFLMLEMNESGFSAACGRGDGEKWRRNRWGG